jgi:hypothetical protein
MDLCARILALTGQRISPQEIYTHGHLALASVERYTHRGEFDVAGMLRQLGVIYAPR